MTARRLTLSFLATGLLGVLALAAPASEGADYRADSLSGSRLEVWQGGQVRLTLDLKRAFPAAVVAPADLGLGDATSLRVVRVADFDGDGSQDALVAVSFGGNAVPEAYTFATYAGGQLGFTKSFSFWGEVGFEPGGRVVTLTEETGQDALRRRYAYARGQLVTLKSESVPGLKASPQWLASSFDPARSTVTADLNGDGVREILRCEVWDRWSALTCGVQDRQGRDLLPANLGCLRFGVLATRTRGYQDLVCDSRLVGRWNGQRYVFPDGP